MNELYYARDNNPSFYQFKETYHFIDAEERQYMIAVKNRQVFQNHRFKAQREKCGIQQPVINNYGFVKLYVKLADPQSKWFSHKDIGKPLVLYDRADKSELVILKSQEKYGVKRRTGTIYVKGLSRESLLSLINNK